MSAPTHRLPRFDAARTAMELALGVQAGTMKESVADHIMAIVTPRDGHQMVMESCHLCGAALLENVVTGRFEMTHDLARHTGNAAASMANAAEVLERRRAESIRRAQREADE